MNAKELIARRPDLLNYGLLNRLCNDGHFGTECMSPGRGTSRDFSEVDARIAITMAAVADTIEHWRRNRTEVLAAIRRLVHDGATKIEMEPHPGVRLIIDVEEIQ